MEEAIGFERNKAREIRSTNGTRSVTPYRCSRLWLWSDSQCQRSKCGSARNVKPPKGVDMAATGGANNFERAETGSVRSEWSFGPTAPAKRNAATVSICRQHGRGPHLQFTALVQSRYVERVKTAQLRTRQNGICDSSRVATDRAKLVRRRTLETIPPWRPPNFEIAAAFNRGCNEGAS